MATNFISKRIYKTLKKEQKDVDRAMWLAGIVGPMTGLPQLITIYRNHSAKDLSLLSWVFFLVLCVIYLSYAIVHKIKPLIVAQILWIIVYGLITIGVLIYR